MRVAAGYAGCLMTVRFLAHAASLTVGIAAAGSADAAHASECLAVKAGIAREIGQLRPDGTEKSFCVYARAGQTMKVTLKPLAPDLVTSGHVISPVSRQSDGGAGGVIFDQRLSEEGRYEIHVGQRFERKAGKFELSVELK